MHKQQKATGIIKSRRQKPKSKTSFQVVVKHKTQNWKSWPIFQTYDYHRHSLSARSSLNAHVDVSLASSVSFEAFMDDITAFVFTQKSDTEHCIRDFQSIQIRHPSSSYQGSTRRSNECFARSKNCQSFILDITALVEGRNTRGKESRQVGRK